MKLPIRKLANFQPDSSDLMGQLLAKRGISRGGLKQGQKIEGTVVEVGPKLLVLDIGGKAEGLVLENEFEDAVDYIKSLKTGDKVAATVVTPENKSGQALLSLRDTAQDQAWEVLEESVRKNQEVSFRVLSLVKGGLSITTQGILGFVPSSQIGAELSKNLQNAVGKGLKGKVIELDRQKEKLVISEKAVSESEIIKKQQKILGQIKEGERFTGKVLSLVNFGAFVQIEKDGVLLDGLVHLSELSWQRVSDAGSVLAEGEEVEVVVIGKEAGRLALSVKQAQKDPWVEVEEKYKPDIKVNGTVSRLGDVGAYVELEPGIEGLIRLTRIPSGIALVEGQKVECFIEDFDKKNRKVSLGLVLKSKPIGYK